LQSLAGYYIEAPDARVRGKVKLLSAVALYELVEGDDGVKARYPREVQPGQLISLSEARAARLKEGSTPKSGTKTTANAKRSRALGMDNCSKDLAASGEGIDPAELERMGQEAKRGAFLYPR
jgi:hypothetical protein